MIRSSAFEDAIHAGLREEVPLPVRELPRQLAGRFCRIGQSGLHDAVPDPRRDLVPVAPGGRRPGDQPGRAHALVAAIPRVERGPVHSQLPQRPAHRQIRALHEPDDLVLLGRGQSHVASPAPEPTRFFEYAILENRLGHDLLELAVFAAQVLDFGRRRFACRIAQQPLLPGLEELLTPAVIEIRRYPFAAAERRDAFLPAEPLQHDPNLLFG